MEKRFFLSGIILVIKYSPNFCLMNFVELRILLLTELFINAVRSLKRNSEIQILYEMMGEIVYDTFIKSLNGTRVLYTLLCVTKQTIFRHSLYLSDRLHIVRLRNRQKFRKWETNPTKI